MPHRVTCEFCLTDQPFETPDPGQPVRCQTCGHILELPVPRPPSLASEVPSEDGSETLEATGRPVLVLGGITFPLVIGHTVLHLSSTRLAECTTFPGSNREQVIPLASIDSIELTTRPSPWWIVIGLATIWIWGLGLLFLVLSLLRKHRSLSVRSRGGRIIALTITGDVTSARAFLLAALGRIESSK